METILSTANKDEISNILFLLNLPKTEYLNLILQQLCLQNQQLCQNCPQQVLFRQLCAQNQDHSCLSTKILCRNLNVNTDIFSALCQGNTPSPPTYNSALKQRVNLLILLLIKFFLIYCLTECRKS